MTPSRISTEKDLVCIVHVQGSSYSNLIAINGSNTSNLCLMIMSCSWSQWHTEYRNRFRCLYTDPHEGKNKKSVLFILGFPEIILSGNTRFLWLQQRFLCQSQAKSWDHQILEAFCHSSYASFPKYGEKIIQSVDFSAMTFLASIHAGLQSTVAAPSCPFCDFCFYFVQN